MSRRRRILAVCSTLVAALVVVTAPGRAEVDRYLLDTGPLRIRDQFLPGLGYLAFDPVSADILADGVWQVDLVLTAGNTFAHSEEVERALDERAERGGLGLSELRSISPDQPGRGLFYLDGEHDRWAIAARRGIGHALQLELVLPVIHIGGGSFDSTIEGFHDAFSLGQAGRLGVPREQFTAYARTGEREVLLDSAPGTSLGDLLIGLRYDLLHSRSASGFELALEGLVKLPTGEVDRLSSSGSADAGLELLGTRYFRGNCLHFAIGAAHLGRHELFDLDAQTIFSGMLAWEVALGRKTTVLLQATVSQSPFEELRSGELTSETTQLTVGLKRVVGGQVLFLGVTENVANFNNTADIGLHLGVTRTFGPR
jgi:hypothetical protein